MFIRRPLAEGDAADPCGSSASNPQLGGDVAADRIGGIRARDLGGHADRRRHPTRPAAGSGHEQFDRRDHLSRPARRSSSAQPRDGAAAHARQQDPSIARGGCRAARRGFAPMGRIDGTAAPAQSDGDHGGGAGQPPAAPNRKLPPNPCCRSAASRCWSTSSTAPERRDSSTSC